MEPLTRDAAERQLNGLRPVGSGVPPDVFSNLRMANLKSLTPLARQNDSLGIEAEPAVDEENVNPHQKWLAARRAEVLRAYPPKPTRRGPRYWLLACKEHLAGRQWTRRFAVIERVVDLIQELDASGRLPLWSALAHEVPYFKPLYLSADEFQLQDLDLLQHFRVEDREVDTDASVSFPSIRIFVSREGADEVLSNFAELENRLRLLGLVNRIPETISGDQGPKGHSGSASVDRDD